MSRTPYIAVALVLALLELDFASAAESDRTVRFDQLPYPADKEQLDRQRQSAYRSKVYPFMMPPSTVTAAFDQGVFFDGEINESTAVKRSLKLTYQRSDQGFCGAYFVVLADVSPYKTLHFRVRGEVGGENFLLGLKDIISHEREDALYAGSIHRYLPQGISQDWQDIAVPLREFKGLDFANFFGLSFLFDDPGTGTVYIDDLRFSKEEVVGQEAEIAKKGYLLLDNFDHADYNALGMPAGCYTKFPSRAKKVRTAESRIGDAGKSLRVSYQKHPAGWAGYYSQLHQHKTYFTDLSGFEALSFWVRGKEGGEVFTVGLADKDHVLIDDVVHVDLDAFLPGGVSTEWTEVVIPIHAFEGLELSQMGSLVLDFPSESSGEIYIDEVRFLMRGKL